MEQDDFTRYELPTVETFRHRIENGLPFLSENDKDALSFPFESYHDAALLELCVVNPGCCDSWGLLPQLPSREEAEARRDDRVKAAAPILDKGRALLSRLSAQLIEMANTCGIGAKGIAFDFMAVLREIDGASLEEDLRKAIERLCKVFDDCDEFSKRCFTGEADRFSADGYAGAAGQMAEDMKATRAAAEKARAAIEAQGQTVEQTAGGVKYLVGKRKAAEKERKKRAKEAEQRARLNNPEYQETVGQQAQTRTDKETAFKSMLEKFGKGRVDKAFAATEAAKFGMTGTTGRESFMREFRDWKRKNRKGK